MVYLMKKTAFLLLVLCAILLVPPVFDLNVGKSQGYINVTGRWWYWINGNRSPLAGATAVIYDLESWGPDPLRTVLTDVNGYFNSGSILNDDGEGEDGLDIFVVVYSTSSAAEVLDPDGYWYYSMTDLFPDCPNGPLNVGENWNATGPTQNERGAWIIFSLRNGLTGGWYWLASTVGYNTPKVSCRWPYGDWPRYWTNGMIDLPDWACWWPDIILHEYGHHVMYSLYEYLPPSMQNHIMNRVSDNTTAWAEGWANFFPLVVFNDPVFTWSNGTHWANINLETKHWCSGGWDDGDEVEGRVAGALWDIFDATNDGYDVLSLGFSRIWNILSSQTDDTFREFWDAWNASYPHPKSGSQLQEWTNTLMAIFQNSIDYRGPGDINADGIVDIVDVGIVADAFGARKGDYNWDQRADIQPEWDFIDIVDIVYLAIHFGFTYDC